MTSSESSPRESERRQATILFADICGFTSLSEKVDAEVVTSRMDNCFRTLGSIVASDGCVIDKFIGDCIIALLVLRLTQLGAGSGFPWAAMIAGAFSAAGTIRMSAVPSTMGATLHQPGILISFLGVVAVQTLDGVREWRLQALPRMLPVVCSAVAASCLLFFVLVMLCQAGYMSRITPILPSGCAPLPCWSGCLPIVSSWIDKK